MNCPDCGRTNPEEAVFCAGCGLPLPVPGFSAADDGVSPQQSPPSAAFEMPAAAGVPEEPAAYAAIPDGIPTPVAPTYAEPSAVSVPAPVAPPPAAPPPMVPPRAAAPPAAPPPVVPAQAAPPPAAPSPAVPAPVAPAPAQPQAARPRVKPFIWIAVAAVLVIGLAISVPPIARAVQFRSNSNALLKADAPGRVAAARALAASKNPEALPLLARAMGDEDAQVRNAAREGLLAFGPAAFDTCVSLLGDRSPEAHAGAIDVVSRLADGRAVEPLCAVVEDDSHDAATRASAIQAAAALGASANDPTPVRYLTEAISDEDEDVRVAAIEGLAGFDDASSVGPLVTAFTTGGQRTSDAAAQTLEAIGSPSVYPLMLATTRPGMYSRSLSLVRRIGPQAADQVVRAITNSDPRVRLAAINTIVAYNYSETPAVNALISRFKNDRVPAVRIAAANALGRFESSAADDYLFTALCKDGTKAIRASAAAALVKIWGGGDRKLLYALRDRSTKKVAKNYKGFIRWGKTETVPIMSDAVIKHGFKSMVLAYLNCGNSRLDKAARRWCSRHGYRVVRRVGSGWGGPRWGGY